MALRKEFHDGRILPLIQKQLELALEKRGHVVHLGQEQVIDPGQFLAVLNGFQEQAVIIQQRHVLVTGSIQRGIEILAGRIGSAILHVQVGKHAQLGGSRFPFQGLGASSLNQGQGICPLSHHDFGQLKSQVSAIGIRFRGMLPEHIGQRPFTTQFHLLGADKGFVGCVNILRKRLIFSRLLDRIQFCIHRHGNRGRIRRCQGFALLRGRGTRRERKRHRYKSRRHCK